MAQVTLHRMLALSICTALAAAWPAGVALAQDAVAYQPALDAAWAGRTGEAIRLIDAYLAGHPDDRAAQLDRARFLAWRGDYAGADQALAGFDGTNRQATALRARILAWAGRRDEAQALNTPLYAADPQDYDNAWTQALILRQGNWPWQALPALATVQAAKPGAKDTRDLAGAVRVPLFSSVGVSGQVYSDSDDIEIRGIGGDASVLVSDRWRLLAGVMRRDHSAASGSPFVPLGGGAAVDEVRVGAGVRFAPSPDTALELWLGSSNLDYPGNQHGGSAGIGHLSFSRHASDAFGYVLAASRDRVDASPRSLEVMRTGLAADMRWTPTLRDTLAARIAFDDFDDHDRRESALVDYRRAVYRGDGTMFDVGGQAEWQHNSRDTDNGYYSPDHYTRIAPLVSGYITLGPEAGLYLSAAIGAQRDESFDSWKRATDLNAELTLGISSHWQLVGRAAYSQRLNQLGRYEGTSVGLELRYRFCEFRADRCPAVR